MAKNFATAARDPYNTEPPTGPQIGTLRIAKVTYDHLPIHSGGTGTIGEMIDDHLLNTFASGGMISEVMLVFETAEQQHQVMQMYKDRNQR